MGEVERLRATIREFEDRKINFNQLGRDVLEVATRLIDERHARARLALVKLGNHFVALSERSFHDDVAADARQSIDELHHELLGLDA